MIEPCDPGTHLRSVGRSPASAYHLTTVRTATAVAGSGALLSRGALQRPNGYADRDLVRARSGVRVAPDTGIDDCVPFYLSRFQPMFVRLVGAGDLAADEVVAIEVSRRVSERSRTFVYSTNPVYDAATYLGPWESVRLPVPLAHVLHHGPWPGMLDPDRPRGPGRPMIMRQAEVLVRGQVPVAEVTAVWAHPGAVAGVAAAFPGRRVVSCRHLVTGGRRPAG